MRPMYIIALVGFSYWGSLYAQDLQNVKNKLESLKNGLKGLNIQLEKFGPPSEAPKATMPSQRHEDIITEIRNLGHDVPPLFNYLRSIAIEEAEKKLLK